MEIEDFEKEFENLFPWDRREFVEKHLDLTEGELSYNVSGEKSIEDFPDFDIVDEVERRHLAEEVISNMPTTNLLDCVFEQLSVSEVLDYLDKFHPEEHQEWYWERPEFMRREDEWQKMEEDFAQNNSKENQ